jgi:Polysaccharide pyruvyl transferase
MKILLCNDTGSKSHIGCQAVSNAHARMIGRLGHEVHKRYFVGEIKHKPQSSFSDYVRLLSRDEPFLSALEGVDAVAVNGEGTIHHNNGLSLIAVLCIAKQRKKATFLVNSLFQAMDIEPDVLNGFDYVSVRDSLSHDYAVSLGIRALHRFDSIVAARFFDGAPPQFFGTVITDWTKSSDSVVGPIMAKIVSGDAGPPSADFFPLHVRGAHDTWMDAIGKLSNASAVVTSRHHAAYIACMAGVPLIALKSHTWKMDGLLRSLGAGMTTVSSIDEVKNCLGNLKGLKEASLAARKRLSEGTEMQHFAMLGQGSALGGEQGELRELRKLDQDIKSRPSLLRKDLRQMDRRRKRENGWIAGLNPDLSMFAQFKRYFGI